MERSALLKVDYTTKMKESLLSGQSLPDLLAGLGFSEQLVTQLSLADAHGNTQTSLQVLDDYLGQMIQVRKKFLEVLTYPFILLLFLTLIMIGLRTYLLPQLEGENLASRMIQHFPLLLLGTLVALILLAFCFITWSKQMTRIAYYQFLSKIPYFGHLVSYYLTAYYAREWGNLLGQGIDMAQIVQLMQEQSSRLFRELGQELEIGLLAGKNFPDQVATYGFFRPELSLIISYGEIKSKLGTELTVYAQDSWQTFFEKVNRASQIIQPLVFIFVALMIVMIYAAMLLPLYQSMPDVF